MASVAREAASLGLDADAQNAQNAVTDGDSAAENPSPAAAADSSAGAGAAQPRAAMIGDVAVPPPEPKRILGVIPNFRAVSAGAMPPPPKPGEAFMLATKNSFDYSAFIYVGIDSLLGEWDDRHAELGKGVAGFGRYYWRGLLSRTDGTYLVLFAMPTLFHQDERYYAMGRGKAWKRAVYAATRVLVTPNYHGEDVFNTSLFVGRGISQGLALAYYPGSDRTVGKFAESYGFALGRVAITNVLREFWPDVAAWARRRKPR